jgi:diacylglycerol kinase (ATP)
MGVISVGEGGNKVVSAGQFAGFNHFVVGCFGITPTEWCIVTLCFGMVLAAEGFNTAIERLVDLVSPDYHPIAGDVKDIAAGAVLICAIAAAIIGMIVFLPYLLNC